MLELTTSEYLGGLKWGRKVLKKEAKMYKGKRKDKGKTGDTTVYTQRNKSVCT